MDPKLTKLSLMYLAAGVAVTLFHAWRADEGKPTFDGIGDGTRTRLGWFFQSVFFWPVALPLGLAEKKSGSSFQIGDVEVNVNEEGGNVDIRVPME